MYDGARKRRTADCRNCLFLKSMVAAKLSPTIIDAICERMWLNRFPRRQVLYLEGNRAAHLYALRSGRVKLVKLDATGREHVTAILESGDLFGIEAAYGSAYATGAHTLTDCELCLVSGTELRRQLAEVPRFVLDLVQYLHDQLRRARERLLYLHHPGACARLAGFLLHHLPPDPGGSPVVAHGLTQREIGCALGISPETVCRAIRALRAEGIIENAAGETRIRDLDALRARAGVD